jgi:peptidoglycan hydrolase CwlO-like protein
MSLLKRMTKEVKEAKSFTKGMYLQALKDSVYLDTGQIKKCQERINELQEQIKALEAKIDRTNLWIKEEECVKE